MAVSRIEQGAFAWGSETAAADAREQVVRVPAPVRPRVREAGPAARVRGRGHKGAAAAEPTPRQLAADGSLPPDSELWDVHAAARFLRRSVSWVYHRTEDGTLPVRLLAGWGVRFVPAELRAWVQADGGHRRR